MDGTGDRAESRIQQIRAWAGLLVVGLGDLAISAAAIWGVTHVDGSEAVAVLTSAFTAISAMTTAYFGIRAATNAAQSGGAQPLAPLGPLSAPPAAPSPVGRATSGP
ncbi:hypothetical protein [Streptomyces sp. NPDC008141]|uniref:hypothetical protein n=1 Tax=Streptomyces sp. NPDC008141 TaxID=3364815 RepID=UPI0036EE084A